MTTQQTISPEAQLAKYAKMVSTIVEKVGLTTWTDVRGNEHATLKDGHRMIDVFPGSDGVRVTSWIDYGQDGRSYCGGKTYRSVAGAVRKIRQWEK